MFIACEGRQSLDQFLDHSSGLGKQSSGIGRSGSTVAVGPRLDDGSFALRCGWKGDRQLPKHFLARSTLFFPNIASNTRARSWKRF